MDSPRTSFYKRSTFVTHLPVTYLYSPSHYWLALEPGTENRWRIGITKFAARMLGEIVDHQFEKAAGDPVKAGEIIGSIEGFKAISDVYCVGTGAFVQSNPTLKTRVELVTEDPYGGGWLYMLEGTPDSKCGDIESYRQLLDTTIDRILEKQKAEDELP